MQEGGRADPIQPLQCHANPARSAARSRDLPPPAEFCVGFTFTPASILSRAAALISPSSSSVRMRESF